MTMISSGESSFSLVIRRTGVGIIRTINEFVALEYALVENDIGALTLTLPDTFSQDLFLTDTMIEVYRTISGVTTLEGDTVWFVRETRFVLNDRGEWLFMVIAFDAKQLLDRRIVTSHAGSAIAAKSAPADNMMRQIVREHLGASATADVIGDRTIIDVEPDSSLYATTAKSFAWRNVFRTVRELADEVEIDEFASFHIMKSVGNLNDLIFRVRRGGWGVDHGQDSGQAITFTPENGSLFNVTVSFDASNEISVALVGGQGEGENRALIFVQSLPALNRSYWNRTEAFIDARNAIDSAQLGGEGYAYIKERVARWRFTAQVQQTADYQYGVHYGWGDVVVASARGLTFDVHLSKVHVKADQNGETISIQVNAESVSSV